MNEEINSSFCLDEFMNSVLSLFTASPKPRQWRVALG